MKDARSAQTAAARAARQQKAEVEARREVEARENRQRQLDAAKAAFTKLNQAFQAVHKTTAKCEALSNHLHGFYDEIDKLAKGKTLFSVTDLVVEQANYVVGDAKTIITTDDYLDRVKAFVPAGDNPTYPDVLLTLRTIQQALERFSTRVSTQQDRLSNLMNEAKVIEAALQYYLNNNGSTPTAEDLAGIAKSGVLGAWLQKDVLNNAYFTFERLDRCNLEEYLSEHHDREA